MTRMTTMKIISPLIQVFFVCISKCHFTDTVQKVFQFLCHTHTYCSVCRYTAHTAHLYNVVHIMRLNIQKCSMLGHSLLVCSDNYSMFKISASTHSELCKRLVNAHIHDVSFNAGPYAQHAALMSNSNGTHKKLFS